MRDLHPIDPPARRWPLVALLAWLCLALGAAGAHASERGHGVSIWSQSATDLVVQPGEIVSVSFKVQRHSEKTEQLVEALELPPGWRPVTPVGRLTVPLDEAMTRLVAFTVPSSAPAGTYEITWRLSAQAWPDIQDEARIRITVERRASLNLAVEEAPGFVVAGEAARVRLAVSNDGNAPVEVALSAEAPDGLRVRFEPGSLSLPIRGQGEVWMTVDTPRDAHRSLQHAIKVFAAAEGADERARAVVLLETVPRADARPQLYRSLPTTLTLTGVLEAGAPSYQAEWRGAGFIDAEQTRQVDFALRGPDTTALSGVYGMRDEYRLRYADPNLTVLLGDHSYRLSWLTDAAAYGRGAGFIATPGILTVGAYHLTPRFGRSQGAQTGAHLGVDVAEIGLLRANALIREPKSGDLRAPRDGVVSLEARLRPAEGHEIQGEIARSAPFPGGEATGTAWRVQATGRALDSLSYDLQHVHATPAFTGYYKDTDLTRAMSTWTFSERRRLRAYYQSDRENLELDPTARSADLDRSLDLATSCTAAQGWCVDGGSRFRWTVDGFTGARTDWEETVTARAQRSGGDLRLNLQGASGAEHRAADGTGALVRLTALAHYELLPGRYVAATLRYAYASLEDDALLTASRSLTLTGAWQVADPLSFDVEYRLMAADVLAQRAQLGMKWAFARRYQLTAQARYESAPAGSPPRLAAQVQLSRGFELPVAPRTDVGAVRGQLTDRSLPGEPGIPGVVLRMGGAVAVTDAQGRFTLPALPPGTHHLYVDNQSLGVTRLLVGGQGQPVEVTGGRTTRISLHAERGAEVRGEVLLVADVAGSVTAAGGGMYLAGPVAPASSDEISVRGAVIELRRGDEVVRRRTDERGSFLVQGLAPGIWTLSVVQSSLPEQHAADRPERQLHLEAGVEEAVLIAIRPRMRRIQMLEGDGPQTLSTP